MSQSVTDSNKQGIVRLINKSNTSFNDRAKSKKQKIDISDNGKIKMAEIGLNHAQKIIFKASEYAYIRCSSSLPTNCKQIKNKKQQIRLKILPSDILNAISFLALPSSPYLTRKYMKIDDKKELNSVFLQ